MKKFGTPIGAGPGSDSEKLGFDGDGTPLPVGSPAFGVAGALRCLAGVVDVEVVVCGRLEGFCWVVGRLGTGLADVLEDDEREVELEVELEEEGELLELELVGLGRLGGLELELELELVVVVMVMVLEELVLSATQLWDTTVAPAGR